MSTTSAVPPTSGPATAFPPLGLTPTSFPMVWDLILVHADASTVLSLRATSKYLHKCTSEKLYKHVGIHITKSGDRLDIDLRAPYSGQRVPGLDWNGARGLCLSRLSSYCVVIDEVVATSPQPALSGVCHVDTEAFRALEKALSNVTSHRCAGSAYASIFALPRLRTMTTFLDPSPHTIVVPELVNPVYPISWNLRGSLATTVEINFRLGDNLVLWYNLPHLPNLQHLILILHKDEIPLDPWVTLASLFYGIARFLPRAKLVICGLELCPELDNHINMAWEQRKIWFHTKIAISIGDHKSVEMGNERGTWMGRVGDGAEGERAEFEDIKNAIAIKTLEYLRATKGKEPYRRMALPLAMVVGRPLASHASEE
ncbi:uncharacterized protein LOC62_07G008895 [Vanrija pseudolonga]|uniref:F-box domain-containing protein n=1 Tax=Vanrija pseudolonga TaxID=143232 RepID=A0AAF0YJ01_9TREE|nr:hypothetical protein LOC62_07G008895 [Vanrija pseudolonga]